MKAASIGAISAGVAVAAFILIFVGVGSNQAQEPTDYKKIIEEGIESKSASAPKEQTQYQRELAESVSSESASPSQPPSQPVQEKICDKSYPTVCIAPYPPDLNCKDVPFSNFQVFEPDPHGFDADKDGIGCES